MCHVAAEMERQNLDLPLLIGGATTSRVHTAVKIHPNYRRGQTVYVNDASRAVGVAASLMSRVGRETYVADVRGEYARIAEAHARGEEQKQRLSLADARANALKLDWTDYTPPRPSFLGTRIFEDYPIAELIDYIDWSPFFATWELNGKFPAILDDAKFGPAARSLYEDAQRHAAEDRRRGLVPRRGHRRLLAGQFRRRRYSGFRRRRAGRIRSRPCTRCASSSPGARAAPIWRCADFIAPRGIADYIGAFVVTAGPRRGRGLDPLQARQR